MAQRSASSNSPQSLQPSTDAIDAEAQPSAAATVRSFAAPQSLLALLAALPGRLAALGSEGEAQALRDLTRLCSGEERMERTLVDLGDLLMNIAPRWKTLAPRHVLELALLGDPPPVLADGVQVARALTLLIDYAVHVTPEGGPLRVSVRPEGEAVVTRVRQFGAPPDAVSLATLIEPFQSAAPDSLRSPTGLELALAATIVEAHGGALWVERPPAGGGLLLGASWPIESQSGVSASGEIAGEPLAVQRERRKVLLVEEDPRMLRYLKANLETAGFSVSASRTAHEALTLADLEGPDAIVLDGGLPHMRDLTFLREFGQYAGAPVVVLGRAQSALTCAQALDAGAADWLGRPFAIEELVARVRAALRRRQAPHPGATEDLLAVGGLRIDLRRRVVTVDGRPAPLSKTEFKLLGVLAQRPGAVFTHEQLLERVWGPGYAGATDFIWVYIRRLRKKIEPDPAAPAYILTAPGVGYRLASHDDITEPLS